MVYSSSKIETIAGSINRWRNKQIAVFFIDTMEQYETIKWIIFKFYSSFRFILESCKDSSHMAHTQSL